MIGADGPATLSSRLNVNLVDLDWVSHEYTPWRLWEMRVRCGLRYLNAYFDSQANEPFAEAAAGSTIFNQRTTNSDWALGPHAAVDLRRRLGFWGLAVLGFVDVSDGWSRVRQNYFASSTTSASGLPQAAQATSATDSFRSRPDPPPGPQLAASRLCEHPPVRGLSTRLLVERRPEWRHRLHPLRLFLRQRHPLAGRVELLT